MERGDRGRATSECGLAVSRRSANTRQEIAAPAWACGSSSLNDRPKSTTAMTREPQVPERAA
jgi:hypothetical protein